MLERFNTDAEYRVEMSDLLTLGIIFSGLIGFTGLYMLFQKILGNPITILDTTHLTFGWLFQILLLCAFGSIIGGLALNVYLKRNIVAETKYRFQTKHLTNPADQA